MTPEQLATLIDVHGPALQLYARQWVDAPEDVVQEALLKLVQQGELPRDPVAWLYQVVRNAAIDESRTHRRRRARETHVAERARWFVEPEIDGLDAEAAIAALNELPLEQREVIVAHLWGGLSFEAIGRVVGCATSTAFRRFSAGLEQLRKALGVPCPDNMT